MCRKRSGQQLNQQNAGQTAMSFGSQILHAYLFAYIYWLMIPLGCTAILMMHHLTGGWWGYPIRRLLEAGTRTFGVMALLFIPILLGMKQIYYPWMNPPEEMLHNPNYHFKLAYLSTNFFIAARGDLFRDSVHAGAFFEQMVARAGRNRRSANRKNIWKG